MPVERIEYFHLGPWRVEPDSGKLIRGSDEKSLRPKEMRLLVYLARNRDRVVPVDELIENVWDGVAASNDSLYFSISRLRRALDAPSDRGSAIKTIPKRGYQLREKVRFPRQRARWPLVAASLAVLLLLSVVIGSQPPAPPSSESLAPDEAANSIAVLPFTDLSPAGDQAYFSEGISAEILDQLQGTRGLRVAARTSSFSLGSRDLDAVSIGRLLNVATIVEGSVRREGDNVKIVVRLVDTGDGFQIWSRSFEHDLKGVLAGQAAISRQIVAFLETTLDMRLHFRDTVPARDLDPRAIDEYLLGLEEMRVGSVASLRRAADHFEAVTRLAPGYGRAKTRLADAKLALLRTVASDDRTLAIEAETLVRSVLRQNPDDAAARRVLASAYLWQSKPHLVLPELEAALSLAPYDARVLRQLGAVLLGRGDVRGALRHLQRARLVDPRGDETLAVAGIALSRLGQIHAARDAFAEAIALNPDNPNYRWLMGRLQVEFEGDIAGGLKNFLRAAEIDRHDREIAAYVAFAYLSLEMPDAAKSWIDRAARLGPDLPSTRSAQAAYLAVTGHRERAAGVAIDALQDPSIRLVANPLLTRTLISLAGSHLLRADQADEAIHRFRQLSPMENPAFLNRFDASQLQDLIIGSSFAARRWMVSMAAMYTTRGRTTQAEEALRRLSIARIGAIGDYREFYRNDDYLFEAEALALSGDIEGALDMLEKAVASNLLFNWQIELQSNVALEALRSQPRFAGLLDTVRSRIRDERTRLAGLNIDSLHVAALSGTPPFEQP